MVLEQTKSIEQIQELYGNSEYELWLKNDNTTNFAAVVVGLNLAIKIPVETATEIAHKAHLEGEALIRSYKSKEVALTMAEIAIELVTGCHEAVASTPTSFSIEVRRKDGAES